MATRVGVIGGSGLYQIEGMTNLREERVDTPYGSPSDALLLGEIGDIEMVFLPRHGRDHAFNPSEVPYRANIYAMKQAGVDWIVSVSAVGSLKEEIVPGHVVVIDQFIDRTKRRADTFFEDGIVAHVPFGDPVCSVLRSALLEAASESDAVVHSDGTYVCMEGPAFSTRAESNLYRSWGASVVGMTNLPEAKLAREAGISYATLALVTDYDCWREGHDDVTVEEIVATLKANVMLAKDVIRRVAPKVADLGRGDAADSLRGAIMTSPGAIPVDRRADLDLLVRRYLG